MVCFKIMRIALLIMISLLCGCQVDELRNEEKCAHERDKLENEICHKVALKLKREKDLIPCGTGGGDVYHVAMLALSFDYRKPLSIEEGRNLLVFAEQELMNAINAEERIRPYLSNYPFGPKNVQIRIFVQDINGNMLSSSAADVISCINGKCRYMTMNTQCNGFDTILEETFDDAEQKAKEHALELKGLNNSPKVF